MKFKPTS